MKQIAIIMITSGVAACSTAAHAQIVHDFGLRFQAPEMINPGETFRVDLWASYEGPFAEDGVFSGVTLDILLGGTGDASIASTVYDSNLVIPAGFGGTITPEGLLGITAIQLLQLPITIGSDIRLFAFNITAGEADSEIDLTIGPGPLGTIAFRDDPFNSMNEVLDTDPDASLTLTPATIRVVPAPASAALIIAGFAFRRRMR